MSADTTTAASMPDLSVRSYRLTSIDMLRGLVLVIMVLDHARDDFVAGNMQNPMTDPNVSALLFFTRWITHFCAPVFVLLAGTSAGLMTARKTPRELGAFLLKRGLWLIFIEWFVIATAWSFAPFGFAQANGLIVTPLQVIWVIGASMVVLAGLQFLGARMCLAIGLAIVLGHNLLDYVWPASATRDGIDHPLWVALHSQMSLITGPYRIAFAYPLLPWLGVMLCGFGIADVFRLEPARRDAWLLRGGIALTLAFVVVRAINVYGDPHPWHVTDRGAVGTLMSFLNTEKYPPSLLYVLMTIGPAAVLCAYAERMHGAIKDILVMFGRVPFAFYVAHLYLLHTLAIVLGVIQGFDARQFFVMAWAFPQGYGVPLVWLYPIWIGVVALLYPFCRWVAAVKARRGDWWLSYL
jgi:uncharacterized membrane protein